MSKHFRFLTMHSRPNARVAQVLIILMLACAQLGMNATGVLAATHYYIDNTNPNCNDSGSATLAQPACSIKRGADLAKVAGDTVEVLHGTYAETVLPSYSGTAGSPITFKGNPGVTITGNPDPAKFGAGFAVTGLSYLVIDGFNILQTPIQGIYVDASDHITITNNHVSYAGTLVSHPYTQGIYLRNTTNSTISGNVTDHNTCIGIRLVLSNNNTVSDNVSFSNYSVVESDAAGIELTGSSNNVVDSNITYSNEDSGINVYVWKDTATPPTKPDVSSTYNLVINNLSYENGDHGIDNNNSPHSTLIGNTIHGNGTVGINFEGEVAPGSNYGTVINNIMSENGLTPPDGSHGGDLRVDAQSTTGMVIDYNLYYKGTVAPILITYGTTTYTSLAQFKSTPGITYEGHGLEADPRFVDPVAPALRHTGTPYVGAGVVGDYHLKLTPVPSPAIDSANADAPSQRTTDLEGNPRVDELSVANTGAGVRLFDDRGAYEYQPSESTLPVVTTQDVTTITSTTATGNGTIESIGGSSVTQHGMVWSTSPNPTIALSTKTAQGARGAGSFTSSITGLTAGTFYYVRAYATNTAGTSYGGEVTFTAYKQPTVTTQAATLITDTAATGNGTVTDLGLPSPTEHGVVWGTAINPTIALPTKTTQGAVTVAAPFTSPITGLTPGTLYHVRAYATNAVGTVYGADVTFTTLWQLPTVTTQPVTAITATTATGNGNITALGVPNPTNYGVVWDTLADPTIALTTKTSQGARSATGAFTSNITGLAPNTLYHVRAYATNTAGTAYGADVTFTSAMLLPTVTTQAVTLITDTTATGNGNVTVLGVPAPTQHGVVWDTSADPTIALTTKTTLGARSATGAFTSNITGLTPGTLYHVRAYATNAAGTVYGADVTFTTLWQIPTVTTQAVTNITSTAATGHGNVTALGVPDPTEHGVVWSTTANPTVELTTKTTQGPVTGTAAFTSDITGLTPGTLYHVRAYATNLGGTAYGADVTFTTQALPTITVDCGAGKPSVTDGKPITCVATVTGGAGFPTPTGSVTWTSSNKGNFSSLSCDLVDAGSGKATCSVTYTPTEVGDGSHEITASYAGDTAFTTGSGVQIVTIEKYPLFLPAIANN